jgi:hypothetical protein
MISKKKVSKKWLQVNPESLAIRYYGRGKLMELVLGNFSIGRTEKKMILYPIP